MTSMRPSSDLPITNKLDTGKREKVFRTKSGDLTLGGNAKIPNGDFAHFLGWKGPSPEEISGEKKPSPGRVIELALHKEITELGKSTANNAASYRNMFASDARLVNLPGREQDVIKENLDSIQNSLEKQEGVLHPGNLGAAMSPQYMFKFAEQSRKDNYRYLEAQYRADWASKSTSMISTMMKARHESIRKSFNEVK